MTTLQNANNLLQTLWHSQQVLLKEGISEKGVKIFTFLQSNNLSWSSKIDSEGDNNNLKLQLFDNIECANNAKNKTRLIDNYSTSE